MVRSILAMGFLAVISTPSPAQDWAKSKLEKSPRHGEWVKVKAGTREVNSFVVYPEVKDKATAVVVIHEIFGLTDWVRLVADQLAEKGFIAITPDLLSGAGPMGGGTESIKDSAEIGRKIRDLKPDQITTDLTACTEYVSKLPACNGKVAVAGFCWGGGQTFRFASNTKAVKGAFAFYGSWPHEEADLKRIECPVYGFYGGNDARINMTVPKSTEMMKAAGKTYDPVTYDGAGHGFMRAGEAPDASPANKKAKDEAWVRMVDLLKKL